MTVRVLEHVVRRVGLALRLSDLATGEPVRDGVTVTAWPAARPELAVRSGAVSAAGVTGFAKLHGLRTYEDGSTARDDWFASPVALPPLPFVVRVEPDETHLLVVREVLAPSPVPVDVPLPRAPSAPAPSGWSTVVASVVTEAGDPAAWAVVEVTVGSFVTGGVADARGAVVVPVPRAVPATSPGSPGSGPIWRVAVRVRFRPADQRRAPGAAEHDPPTITSLLTQAHALVADGAALVDRLERDLTATGPLVVASSAPPPPPPTAVVVRPVP